MKVRELIEILSELDPETQIGYIDHEWDIGNQRGISFIKEVELIPAGWVDAEDGKTKDFDIYRIL